MKVNDTKKKKKSKKKLKPGEAYEEFTIERLTNSIYFFLQCVFIIKAEEKYQLIIIHNNRLIYEKSYRTARGSKIAFMRSFGGRGWNDVDTKALWSGDYPPLREWMFKKMAIAGKGITQPV